MLGSSRARRSASRRSPRRRARSPPRLPLPLSLPRRRPATAMAIPTTSASPPRRSRWAATRCDRATPARRRLDPPAAIDNVGAGVLSLGHRLQETGGDPAPAAAGYYQGISSVRSIGMLPETRRYVANVMALRARFGG